MYAQWVAKDPLMWMSIFKPRFDKTYDYPNKFFKTVLFEFWILIW